jgi:hypothetical protein
MDQEHIVERAACTRVLHYSWDDVGLRVAAMAETRDMFAALQIPTETLRMSTHAEQARKALEQTPVK